jgi:hypothetical protein
LPERLDCIGGRVTAERLRDHSVNRRGACAGARGNTPGFGGSPILVTQLIYRSGFDIRRPHALAPLKRTFNDAFEVR